MRFKLRDDGHPFQHLQALSEATSFDRVGEPSQFQARLVNIFLVFFLLTLSGALSFLPRAAVHAHTTQDTPTGDWVARQADARDTGRDAVIEMRMRLFDRQGRQRERVLELRGIRSEKAGADGIADRSLIRFSYPNDIKGTGLLVLERPGKDDDRYLYLPALGRVRRIAGAERQESFAGSDLSYEEIGGRALDDYTYELLDAKASWQGPDGKAHPAYRLKSTAKDATVAYPSVVSLVRADNFVVVQADIFDRRGTRAKQYVVKRLDRPSGVWTVMEAVMSHDVDRTRTELVVTSARYNTGLSPDAVSRRALEQPAR
jgi:Outer membrane lipoprotein-sorting protein